MFSLQEERFREGQAGAAQLTKIYHATFGQGRTLAADEGYEKGEELIFNDYVLELVDIEVSSRGGIDVVSIFYVTPGRTLSAQTSYNDNKIRKDGDEEWYPEMASGEKRAADAVDKDGSAWSSSWPYEQDEPVVQPAVALVWKKWMNKNTAGPNSPPITLPNTKTKALAALRTYLPGETGDYETNAPQLMYRLGSTGIQKKFLCVDVAFEEDGDLVCRVARFKYSRTDWPTAVYG